MATIGKDPPEEQLTSMDRNLLLCGQQRVSIIQQLASQISGETDERADEKDVPIFRSPLTPASLKGGKENGGKPKFPPTVWTKASSLQTSRTSPPRTP